MFNIRNRHTGGWRKSNLVVEALEARQLLHGGAVAEIAAEGEGDMAPDFALVDVNESSDRYNEAVSPRDYLGQVSGWYLGHAT